MSKIKIISPYFREGKWMKANFHVHPTSASENTGYLDKTIIREYIKAGYGIVSLTGCDDDMYLADSCGSEKTASRISYWSPGLKKEL